MNKILCVVLLTLLVNCATIDTSKETDKEQPRTNIDSIVDVLRGIQLPKF